MTESINSAMLAFNLNGDGDGLGAGARAAAAKFTSGAEMSRLPHPIRKSASVTSIAATTRKLDVRDIQRLRPR
jgi:hypothetical protein